MWLLFGVVEFDFVVFVFGVGVFLFELLNFVVCVVFDGEYIWFFVDFVFMVFEVVVFVFVDFVFFFVDMIFVEIVIVVLCVDLCNGFKGGWFIGLLECVLVMFFMFVVVYLVLVVMFVVKGIVCFLEIFCDGEIGVRVEYFLVGSFVSWVIGFGVVFFVWWVVYS